MEAKSFVARGRHAPVLALALAAALLSLAPAPAHALFGDDEARQAIIELRTESRARADHTNRELAQLNMRLDQTNARISEMTTRYDERLRELATRMERLEASARGQIELQAQLEGLRLEIATLRGRLEVQTNELAQTQRQQREVFSTVDGRLRRFEPVQVTIDGQSVQVDQTERRNFEAALTLFRGGDFRGALAAFQQFELAYPESAYAPGAAFWIGSSQFALKDYKAAIATHSALIAKKPDGPRVPDATLNLGYAQIESGDAKTGRKTLEGLVAKFPASPAAQAAKERLAALPAEKPARVDPPKRGR